MISVYDDNGKLVRVALTRDEQEDLARRNVEFIRNAEKKDVSGWSPPKYFKKKSWASKQKGLRQKGGKK